MKDNGEQVAAVSGTVREEKSATTETAMAAPTEIAVTASAELDVMHRKLEDVLAENERLYEHDRAIRARLTLVTAELTAIETSTSWRFMVKIHAVIWFGIRIYRRLWRAAATLYRHVRNLFLYAHPFVDDDLLETCLIPDWDPESQTWKLKLDRARLKASMVTNEKVTEATAPYVIKPIVSPDPTIKRPLVIHVIANVHVGGSTQLIIDLMENLADRYDQEVVTAELWAGGEHQGMTTHHFPTPVAKDAVTRLFARKKPAIVHVHYWDNPWYRTVMQALAGIPCKVLENINTPVMPYIDGCVSHYVYVSAYVRREFGAGADTPAKSSVIHPGINLSLFDRAIDEQITADAIGMVYRLENDKLRQDSIQLFIEVARRRPRTKIYIVGGGSFFRSYVEQTKAAGVRQNFHFTGYVPYDSLPAWYEKFAIFVAPVWKESFGQVSVFAMNKKMAVGGYKIGALPEILGYDDTLGENITSAATKIVTLLDDPERRRTLGQRNRERAQAVFGVTAMAARYGEIYDRLLAE